MATIKLLHQTFATLSFLGFFVRGILMLRESPLLHTRFARVVPHVIDTGLLAAALTLMINIRQYPFVHHWLTAKVVGLLLYIALGTIALRRGRTRGIRIAAWVAALGVFLYIVLVALTHSPTPGFT
jgi:uncharacterized membrane protein SirB2